MGDRILDVRNLSKSIEGQTLFRDVEFTVEKGIKLPSCHVIRER